MKRDLKIDIIKGIAILSMVLGHTYFIGTHFIYMFHMAVFFMASGYFISDKSSDTIINVKNSIIKRIKGLWLPCVIWNTIYTLLNNFFIQTNIYTTDTGISAFLDPSVVNISKTMSIKEMGVNIAKGLLMAGHTILGGAFWFLRVLFYISVIYVIIDFCLKKILKTPKRVIIAQGIVSAIFLAIGYFMSLKNIEIFATDRCFTCYSLYYIGMLLHKTIKTEKLKLWHYIIMSVSGFVTVVILSCFGSISIGNNDYVNPAFMLAASLGGWFFLFGIAGLFENIKYLNSIFIVLGQNTLAIVIFHFLCFKPINLIVSLVYEWPMSTVAGFPVNNVSGCWWIAFAISGTLIPIGIWMVWKKIKKVLFSKQKKDNQKPES